MDVRPIALVCGLALACSCTRGPEPPQEAGSPAGAAAAQRGPAANAGSPQPATADTSQPLGEFEPLREADVDLYLKVMRAAADRVKNMPPADRQVLKMYREMTTGGASGQVPTPEHVAALQRLGDLMALDATVAREMGVARRFSSVSGRVPMYGMPEMSGSSGDDDPMTPEQRAALKVRIEKFRARRQADATTCEPHRAEIESLQRQVNFTMHPGGMPK